MTDVRRIYIDACCFIDMVKTAVGKALDNDRETDVWHLKRLFEANRDGEVSLFTSTLSIAECTHVGEGELDENIKNRFNRLLLSGQYVKLVQITPFIAQDARDLRWQKGLATKGADGIHIASALDRKCEEFLSSNGKLDRIQRLSSELSRLGLYVKAARDTACLPAKYRQLRLEDDETAP